MDWRPETRPQTHNNMSIIKRPINPRRLRKALPHGFGWIDHLLLSGGHLGRPGAQALGLYCVLVCAGDHQGMSYYSEARLCALLGLDTPALRSARGALREAGLIDYAKPLYQVLAVDPEEHCDWPVPRPPSKPSALPPGLNLRAMVEASLREGGVL